MSTPCIWEVIYKQNYKNKPQSMLFKYFSDSTGLLHRKQDKFSFSSCCLYHALNRCENECNILLIAFLDSGSCFLCDFRTDRCKSIRVGLQAIGTIRLEHRWAYSSAMSKRFLQNRREVQTDTHESSLKANR